ncbi:MAG: GDP-L-fucose synthase [Candidatus Vogelbacteria bacterium]|nr:GDP-L-fucose synthase [Candidatus Vogelbacteria bacterium]
MEKQSKIFVAGHRGLLGASLIKELLAQGYAHLITRTHQELDLTDRGKVNVFFRREKPEYVFLTAGRNGGIKANATYPADFFHANIAIQDSVFEAAQKNEIKHLVFYASSCIYPKISAQPMKEEYLLTGAIEPTSEGYAAAKIAGIFACRSYNNQHQTKRFIALVPNSMFGPNDHFDLDNAHVFSSLIRKFHEAKNTGERKIVLWGSGSPRREFVFVDDVAKASIFAMQNAGRLENIHYNIGSGQDFSIKELAAMIVEVVGFKGNVEWNVSLPDGAPRKLLDSSRFLALGWRSQTEIMNGLRKTYEWYNRNSN